jgi:hypothetical protein
MFKRKASDRRAACLKRLLESPDKMQEQSTGPASPLPDIAIASYAVGEGRLTIGKEGRIVKTQPKSLRIFVGRFAT